MRIMKFHVFDGVWLLFLLTSCRRAAMGIQANRSNSTTGMVLCGGNNMMVELMRTVWTVVEYWRSGLGVAVFHCAELSDENIQRLVLIDPSIYIKNICASSIVYNMSLSHARKRLRGFFCKIASLVESPFAHTMLADLDVVWFQNPTLLFRSKPYIEHKALFFRARSYLRTKKTKGRLIPDEVLTFFKANGMDTAQNATLIVPPRSPPVPSQPSLHDICTGNGINLFWRYGKHGSTTCPTIPTISAVTDIQDSSVVLFHKPSHPKSLEIMWNEIARFDVGYGDKELFWISTTLAGEDFAFSPFLAGQYGDCYGVMLHFDPTTDDPEKTLPFYANAEYMVEKELKTVGEFTQDVILSPMRVSPSLSEVLILKDQATWSKPRGSRNCTCDTDGYGVIIDSSKSNKPSKRLIQCHSIPRFVSDHMLLAEWITLAIRLNLTAGLGRKETRPHQGDVDKNTTTATTTTMSTTTPPGVASTVHCLPVFIDKISQLEYIFSPKNVSNYPTMGAQSNDTDRSSYSVDCTFIGCIDTNFSSSALYHSSVANNFTDKVCCPISFT